jgi:hypothetical protein
MKERNQEQDGPADAGEKEPLPQRSGSESDGDAPHRLGDGSPAIEPRRGGDAAPASQGSEQLPD